MPVDEGLARLSDDLLFAAVLAYSVAMLAFALVYATSRARRPAAAASPARDRELVGAGAPVAGVDVPVPDVPAYLRPGPAEPAGPVAAEPVPSAAGTWAARVAVLLLVGGWLVHGASLVTRGLSVQRVPWGNMYEFSSSVTFAALAAYLVLLVRQRRDVVHLGAFVLLPSVLYLGLAATVLYAPAAPLVPALHSYWITIHVSAAVAATGVFMVAGVLACLYLLRARWERRGGGGVGRLLPAADVLERTVHRLTVFAFPVWTFAIIAGAIWAEGAWGRYWGWDPKETWALISWVLYAGQLHARTTPGWRGPRTMLIAVLAFASMLMNYFGVNLWITGLHSYGGVG